MPLIVAKDEVARANKALTGTRSLANIVGPALAKAIVAAVGAGWAIGLDGSLCRECSLLRADPAVARAVRVYDRSFSLRGSAGRNRHLRDPTLAMADRGAVQLAQFSSPFMVVGPILLGRLLNGVQLWGLLLSAMGLGGLAGAAPP